MSAPEVSTFAQIRSRAQPCSQLNSSWWFDCEMLESMAELIVMERIDGSPVAWRCSDCRQKFSVRGKLTVQERHRQVTAEFEVHMRDCHKAGEAVREMAFAAGVPLPK